MATITHHGPFDGSAAPAVSYWTTGLAAALFMLFALLLFYMTTNATTEVASLAPALTDPPLAPPILPIIPVM